MLTLGIIYFFIRTAITLMVVVGVALVVLRAIFDYSEANPFTWHYRNVRRATEPVLLPARAILRGFRLDTRVAPLIVVIMLIAVWLVLVQLTSNVLNTIAGVFYAITSHKANAAAGIIGYVLFGLLGLYAVAILIRILFSWVGASYANRFFRLMVRITEPLLGPLRRLVPLVGMFDVSALIAYAIVWVCQMAVAATLLRDWPVQFF
ncbi:MAG TPA: YggT family protein [Pyrinomonadaceae bacterium]|jgi:YggT family protein|nr:YggT family protein [Pyrinomonadaceae bacterium]